jgi:hypothetical protein
MNNEHINALWLDSVVNKLKKEEENKSELREVVGDDQKTKSLLTE